MSADRITDLPQGSMKTPGRLLDRPWAVAFVAGVALLMILGAIAILPFVALDRAVQESGPVESVSVGLHLMVAALAATIWRRAPLAGFVVLASLLMAAREIDLQTAFTHYSVFSTKQYVYAGPGVVERIASAVLVLGLGIAVILLVWRERLTLRALRRLRSPAIGGLVGWVVSGILLKGVDNAPRELNNLGRPAGEVLALQLTAVEELGEMALPVLALILLIQLARSRAQTLSGRTAAL